MFQANPQTLFADNEKLFNIIKKNYFPKFLYIYFEFIYVFQTVVLLKLPFKRLSQVSSMILNFMANLSNYVPAYHNMLKSLFFLTFYFDSSFGKYELSYRYLG